MKKRRRTQAAQGALCPIRLVSGILANEKLWFADADRNGDVEKALRSIKVPFLYMPSETDLYFPLGDARYEAAFIPACTLTPIPSLWGHTAGAASNPADGNFLNENISRFLSANR